MGNIRYNSKLQAALLSSAMLGAIALAAPVQANAADLLVDPPIIEAPVVESRGGWYLRGDITYDWQESRGAYAYSNGGPGGGPDDYIDPTVEEAFDIGIGIGYQVSDYLRVDATADYVFEADFEGHLACGQANTPGCTAGTSTETAVVSTLKILANVYADLGHFNGITPYVGAGIGGAYVSYKDYGQDIASVGASPQHQDQSSWRFAYALHAGVSYDLSESLKLDLGYSYNRIEGGDLTGYDVTHVNTYPQAYDKGFDNHIIRAGLRFAFH